MRKIIGLLVLLVCSSPVWAHASIYEAAVERPLPKVYKALKGELEDRSLFVVFEADIGANMERFADRWGDDYNRNELEAIKSMVFCNASYSNQVSNADPSMLALCPLHLTVIHKDGLTRVLFLRPSDVAGESPAAEVLEEVEARVIKAIDAATG